MQIIWKPARLGRKSFEYINIIQCSLSTEAFKLSTFMLVVANLVNSK